MIRTDDYLEPLKFYESSLKETHKENVEKCFQDLTDKSKVDIDANKATCDELYKTRELAKKANSKHGLIVFFEIVFIILLIVLIGVGVFFFIKAKGGSAVGLIFGGIGCVIGAVGLFLLVILVFRKKRKALKKLAEQLEAKAKQLEQEAWAQMAPLNSSFNELISPHLFSQSAPLIEMDDNLSSLTEERIVNQFDCELDRSTDHSTLVVQSGRINTNPFILRQALVMKMLPETYTGTLVITYTRTVSDGNGGTRTTTVTQTLVAHVTRPKPNYSIDTTLTYYTDLASRVSFSRTPAGLVGKSDKEMLKIADKKDREEDKKAARALKKGESYTKLANSKFEAYMNATGRDHDVDYRVMFTPLAQANYCYNFSKQDDIYYTKNKCENIVRSLHDNGKDYSGSPLNYISFDYEVIQKKFMEYNMSFFEGIYFDFLPLISIPVFHENQSEPYVAPRGRKEILSMYESEVIANRFNPSVFKPEGCDTDIIIKVVASENGFATTAYGFHADPRVDYVPTLGGDGRTHMVPVHYYEYLPVSSSNYVKVSSGDSKTLDKEDENGINYKKYQANLIS